MNPFLVPGCDDPKTPLDPGVRGEIEDYVPVDRTTESFDQFTADFADGRRVLEQGRFVLVHGPSGCGKTALINRCAWWLGSAQSPDLFHHLVDVRLDLELSDTVADRRSHVSRRVVGVLNRAGALHPDSDVLKHPGDANLVYPLLGAEMGAKTFVTVLLPPSGDLIEELRFYARFTRSKMLVFAETAFVGKLSGRLGELDRSPLRLEVGGLRPEDVDAYAKKRLAQVNGWPFDDPPPPVGPGALAPLMNLRSVSIGELQQTLHDVYEDIVRNGPPAPQVVTDMHFLKSFFRRAGGEGSGAW